MIIVSGVLMPHDAGSNTCADKQWQDVPALNATTFRLHASCLARFNIQLHSVLHSGHVLESDTSTLSAPSLQQSFNSWSGLSAQTGLGIAHENVR